MPIDAEDVPALNGLLSELYGILDGRSEDHILALVGGLVIEVSVRIGGGRQDAAETIVRSIADEALSALEGNAQALAEIRQGGAN